MYKYKDMVTRGAESRRFVKYVSSSAVSSRWDATAEYQVSSEDIEKESND
jgi:hypothetical protein